eukprot:m.1215407 g.1215407  ORF g.1215407 m.1215407 type:complete len:191 (-) comp24609_c0_seq1:4662-5234(-)
MFSGPPASVESASKMQLYLLPTGVVVDDDIADLAAAIGVRVADNTGVAGTGSAVDGDVFVRTSPAKRTGRYVDTPGKGGFLAMMHDALESHRGNLLYEERRYTAAVHVACSLRPKDRHRTLGAALDTTHHNSPPVVCDVTLERILPMSVDFASIPRSRRMRQARLGSAGTWAPILRCAAGSCVECGRHRR